MLLSPHLNKIENWKLSKEILPIFTSPTQWKFMPGGFEAVIWELNQVFIEDWARIDKFSAQQ